MARAKRSGISVCLHYNVDSARELKSISYNVSGGSVYDRNRGICHELDGSLFWENVRSVLEPKGITLDHLGPVWVLSDPDGMNAKFLKAATVFDIRYRSDTKRMLQVMLTIGELIGRGNDRVDYCCR